MTVVLNLRWFLLMSDGGLVKLQFKVMGVFRPFNGLWKQLLIEWVVSVRFVMKWGSSF